MAVRILSNKLPMKTLQRNLLIFFALLYFFTSTVVPVFANISYTYDANGNMTSDQTNCYTYNDANELAKVRKKTTG